MNHDQWVAALAANPAVTDAPAVETYPESFVFANKLQLLLRERGVEHPGVEQQAKKNQQLLSSLSEVAAGFESEVIEWLLIKWPRLPYPHGDLDILVNSGLKPAERSLEDLDYEYEDDRDPYRRKYVRSDGDFRIEVDLHTAPAWVGVEYLRSSEIFSTRSTREFDGTEVAVPGPEFELLIWAAHDMRSNQIPLADVLVAHRLLEEVELADVRERARDHNWLGQFAKFVSTVGAIYEALFGGQFGEGEKPPDIDLPHRFPVDTMTWLKLEKLVMDARHSGLKRGARDATAYLRFDVPQLIGRLRA